MVSSGLVNYLGTWIMFAGTVNSLMLAGINVCVFKTKPCSWGLIFVG